jgi:hypothetical protein
MKKISKNSGLSRQELLARVALTVLACALISSDAMAAENADLKVIGDKLRNTILIAVNTVGLVVAVVMIAVLGIGYASKGSSERGEEDMKKLKAGVIRVVVGCALAMGAGTIGTFIISNIS